ncbi:MAG TPA: hypothetical protein VKD23_08465 [Terriglobales bacterium]|nr:hypothetical protein [Terriglobales bacterium]
MTLPVWYLQAGSADGAGNFQVHNQASAVLVAAQKKGENDARKFLLTVQHALRSGDLRAGCYHTIFHAWPPSVGYNPATAIPVSILAELTPDATSPLAEPEDLAFLLLPRGATGSPVASLLEDALCQPNLDELNIAGTSAAIISLTTTPALSRRRRTPTGASWEWPPQAPLESSVPETGDPQGGSAAEASFIKGGWQDSIGAHSSTLASIFSYLSPGSASGATSVDTNW